jgi:hypothetical protein
VSTKAGQLHIMDWLADCRDQCQAENVVWLIRQFAAYVDSAIAGKKESDMADTAIVGLALRDKQHLEAALRIGEEVNEIKHKVMSTLLRCVQDGLKEWADRQDNEDWEVVVTWKGGNWIERPNERFLPLLLRKRAWPALVGAGIVADNKGPWDVFIEISGPTQEAWNSQVKTNRDLYGEQNTFIGQESRQRIAGAIQMDKQLDKQLDKQSDWWVKYGRFLRAADVAPAV